MAWEPLWKYPPPTGEGTLPFRFENFGTFAGPQFESLNYNYDASSEEGTWQTMIPGDFSFKNDDLGAYLYNNEFNYVGFHCDSVSTAMMTLEASYGNIPTFNVFATNTNVNGNINATGNINVAGNITIAGSINHTGAYLLSGIGDIAAKMNSNTALAASKKSFDIKHPSKEDHRLRYICLEGPEADVFYRGRLVDKTRIDLPDYWKELVDTDSITVNLTPHGTYQELFVKDIQWGTKIEIRNSNGGPINCSYVVHGTRKDCAKNISEYQGLTPADYPGDNSDYTINGK